MWALNISMYMMRQGRKWLYVLKFFFFISRNQAFLYNRHLDKQLLNSNIILQT